MYQNPRGSSAHSLHLLKLGDWFQIDLLPVYSHQDHITSGHAPFDKVLLSTIAYRIERTKPLHFASGDALLASYPLRLLIIPIRDAFLGKYRLDLEQRLFSACGNHGCIVGVSLRQTCKPPMLFGHKAPGFLGSFHPLQQLYADTIHLCGMGQNSLFLAWFLERYGSGMQTIMTGLAERQQVAFLIASILAPEDEVMHF